MGTFIGFGLLKEILLPNRIPPEILHLSHSSQVCILSSFQPISLKSLWEQKRGWGMIKNLNFEARLPGGSLGITVAHQICEGSGSRGSSCVIESSDGHTPTLQGWCKDKTLKRLPDSVPDVSYQQRLCIRFNNLEWPIGLFKCLLNKLEVLKPHFPSLDYCAHCH